MDIQPVALSIGNVHIYWYGIIIAFAFILQIILLERRTRDPKNSFGIDNNSVIDFSFGAIIFGFLCARIYYVVFKWDYYCKNPLEIVQIWNGGIAIYGGIIGAILYGLYYTKKRNIHFLNFADLLIPYLAFAQSIGRWGNFINREAYGSVTELPWKMGIYIDAIGDYSFVHPTFLYESLLTFFLFVLLIHLSKNRKFEGQILYTYLMVYGTFRALIEGLRTDSLMLLGFRVSQVLSILLAVIFCYILLTKLVKYGKNK
ncbi:MAG: prolipoprotein diacylglyceryl transferase [Clostridia bacterium]|nr:prolipoprotein diacylglyceryl transferase [Clostridia bacterium]